MNILPQSDVLLCGSSTIRNPNNVTNNGLVTGSVFTINGQNPKEKASNSFTDAHKKQPQQPGDPTLQMRMKGVDLARPVQSEHRMFQPLPDIGHNHYQLGNLSKVSANPAKASVVRSSDKLTESSHSPSIAVAGQQQQVVSRVKPTVSSASATVVPGTVAYSDRLSLAYTGSNFPTGAIGFQICKIPCSRRCNPHKGQCKQALLEIPLLNPLQQHLQSQMLEALEGRGQNFHLQH